MRSFIRCLPLFIILSMVGCKSARQTLDNARTDENGVMDITIATMTKDAIRLKGEIQAINDEENKRNSFDFKVQEIVKYGSTFSSAEPKVGEVVTLLTSRDVSFKKGQVIIIDVLTPRFDQGSRPMRVRLGQP